MQSVSRQGMWMGQRGKALHQLQWYNWTGDVNKEEEPQSIRAVERLDDDSDW